MPENNPVDAAPSPEISIKRALQTIADQINDGTSLTVETKVQVITTAGGVQVTGQPVTVARTEISIDGDRAILVPIMLDTGELTVPQAVYDLHERHVSDAQLYRKELLNTLVDFVRNRR